MDHRHQIPPCVALTRETLLKNGRALTGKQPPTANLALFVRSRAEDGDTKDVVFLEALDESQEKLKRRTLTFSEFDKLTNRFANLLTSKLLGVGSSIGFIGDNLPEMHITYIGTGKVGGLCAPLNPKDSLDKWKLTFLDCEARAVVVQDTYLEEKFFSLLKEVPSIQHVWIVASKKSGDHALPEAGTVAVESFDDALQAQSEGFEPSAELKWSDPFLLVYTSGTTGNPKGVAISSEIIWRCAQSINDHYGFTRTDTTFAQLSGFHVNHIVVSFWGALAGAYRCLMSNRFRAEPYFQKIKDEQITISSVVPTNLAYALKAEIESGAITKDEAFQKSFQGFFVESFSPTTPAATIKNAWKKALEASDGVIDPVRFQENLGKELLPFAKTPQTFGEAFGETFSLTFARAFQPIFKKRYGLAPDRLRIICGAGDLALDLATQFSRLTGLQITQGWGMSEGTCYNSMSLPRQPWLLYWLTLGSIGLEMSTTNMGIISTDGDLKAVLRDGHLVALSPEDMAQGKVGMIAMRGAVTSLGYYLNPQANESSYVDGWLLTGDAGCALTLAQVPGFKTFVRDCRKLAFEDLSMKYPFIEDRFLPLIRKMHETGNSSAFLQVVLKDYPHLAHDVFYFIKGRIKDIIITKGQNIPCDEIEAGALGHPGVFEAVAVGIPDIEDGEVPGIVCTRHPQATVTAEALLTFARDRKILPRLQWPVMAAIVESLPKTPTGKYQRMRAREVFDRVEGPFPRATAKFAVQVLEVSVTPDYPLSRRPKTAKT